MQRSWPKTCVMDTRAGPSRNSTGSPLELSFEFSPTDYISGSSCARSGNSTYYSFPSPLSGRSPTLPSFNFPKYGYYHIEGGSAQQQAQSPSGVPITHQTTAQWTVCYAFIQSINFFVGVSSCIATVSTPLSTHDHILIFRLACWHCRLRCT